MTTALRSYDHYAPDIAATVLQKNRLRVGGGPFDEIAGSAVHEVPVEADMTHGCGSSNSGRSRHGKGCVR